MMMVLIKKIADYCTAPTQINTPVLHRTLDVYDLEQTITMQCGTRCEL